MALARARPLAVTGPQSGVTAGPAGGAIPP